MCRLHINYPCLSQTSVRFCLSCDPLICNFITFKINIILKIKLIVDMDVVIENTCKLQRVITRVAIQFSCHDFIH